MRSPPARRSRDLKGVVVPCASVYSLLMKPSEQSQEAEPLEAVGHVREREQREVRRHARVRARRVVGQELAGGEVGIGEREVAERERQRHADLEQWLAGLGGGALRLGRRLGGGTGGVASGGVLRGSLSGILRLRPGGGRVAVVLRGRGWRSAGGLWRRGGGARRLRHAQRARDALGRVLRRLRGERAPRQRQVRAERGHPGGVVERQPQDAQLVAVERDAREHAVDGLVAAQHRGGVAGAELLRVQVVPGCQLLELRERRNLDVRIASQRPQEVGARPDALDRAAGIREVRHEQGGPGERLAGDEQAERPGQAQGERCRAH